MMIPGWQPSGFQPHSLPIAPFIPLRGGTHETELCFCFHLLFCITYSFLNLWPSQLKLSRPAPSFINDILGTPLFPKI